MPAQEKENEKDPSAALGMTIRKGPPHFFIPLRKPASAPSGHLLPGEGGSMPPSRIVISSESEKSFSFAVKKGCEERDHMKHRTLCGVGSRCFMQTALRRKMETANEKDPSAALGMTILERAVSHSLLSRVGSEPPPLRGASFRGKEGVCRLPASSFRAKARNLFRLRSGKRCEERGSQETPHSLRRGITVLHADSFTKENGNGKRKRSLGCARDDNTGEGCLTFPFIPRRERASAPSGHLLPEEGGSMPPSPPRPFSPFKYPHRMAAGAGCIFGVFGMV